MALQSAQTPASARCVPATAADVPPQAGSDGECENTPGRLQSPPPRLRKPTPRRAAAAAPPPSLSDETVLFLATEDIRATALLVGESPVATFESEVKRLAERWTAERMVKEERLVKFWCCPNT